MKPKPNPLPPGARAMHAALETHRQRTASAVRRAEEYRWLVGELDKALRGEREYGDELRRQVREVTR